MSTLSSANVTDVNLVLKERTNMRLCLNMLIFTHNLGNWLMVSSSTTAGAQRYTILRYNSSILSPLQVLAVAVQFTHIWYASNPLQ